MAEEWNAWYHENSEDFNKARREEYANNGSKREKARASAQRYRDSRKKGRPLERVMTRMLEGKLVDVLSSGAVAEELGCSRQMIVNWEKRGWIPRPTFPDKHRIYTKAQAKLIYLLASAVDRAKVKGTLGLDERLSKVIAKVAGKW